MSVPMIPIDPDKRDDLYYRYKMPTIQTKVEGSGNGIKTVFPNIHDVCLAINRPEEVLMKFFQSEIGAQRTVLEKDDKFLIMGSHTEERVQEKIYDFIRKFVLCRSCRNPETQLFVERNKKDVPHISMSCGACGKVMKLSDLDARYVTAIVTYFAKNPQVAMKKGAGTAEARSSQKNQQAAAAAAAAAVAPPAEPEKKQIQRSDLEDTREPPQKILARCMQQYPDESEEVMRRCIELMTTYNLKEKMGPLLVLDGIELAEKEFMAGLRRHSRLLKRFCRVTGTALLDAATDEATKSDLLRREKRLQSATIEESARICARRFEPEQMVVILFVLFIEGVLKSATIEEWCGDEKPISKVDPAVDKKMKQAAAPLVEWLVGST
ncbi:putative eukaryotic translation initiation factor 5 [Trypanosoma cruzi]|uniref:Eukaryotic translation initiation factor 5, putative n=2 Tax=Trypanosoma cruzi TaxID=5693 RepID=Q4DZB0_TRYCC|nr:eukaryotic translation initiation factor 5, putative [Trypanosoma cruzi]EAN97839.1 eukaryotic translation initiation factor 5, putative [Trypanosoma cruzi]PWV18314.1 putative eukaryotic translation initiation factor 5 [Trypanosoma cruzi]RNC39617.1 putative eukaryotic translation initiation factor 5 [Trypanosoma cruzi]7ASE_Y Chain Y, Eukaryotic translation initiation factor 5, putative [Trypanosoma cruzi]|eukprot:XP_819690.1 eukaryotic translation initiation factor 5 [Trypanosoma cruzi strain CL Brener]